MTPVETLLDQLHDWIVAYDRTGKTFADFDRDFAASHAELLGQLDTLDAESLEAYGILMSMAEARNLLRAADQDPNDPILREEHDA